VNPQGVRFAETFHSLRSIFAAWLREHSSLGVRLGVHSMLAGLAR